MKRRLSLLLVACILFTLLPISATAVPDDDLPPRFFVDVPEGHWAESYIMRAAVEEFIAPWPPMFHPYNRLTRAQAAQILLNITGLGLQPFPAEAPFPDVPAHAWYAPAIAWAREEGIVLGHADGTFAPGGPVTRQEFFVMLERLARWMGLDTSDPSPGVLWPFQDNDLIARWAEDAVLWGTAVGLIRGYGGNVNPDGNIIRAEAAVLAVRFADMFP